MTGKRQNLTTRKIQIIKDPSSAYRSLLEKVRRTLLEGQARIEQERVRTYWETGRHIYDDILKNKDRAEYGTEVIRMLAKDLNTDYSLLQRCVQFARTYPRLPIVAGRQQFKWSHYRTLITISDDKKRLSLERSIVQKGWTAEELESRIRESRGSETKVRSEDTVPYNSSQELLAPLRGELYHYQLVDRPTLGEGESGLLVDLGFGVFHNIDPQLLSHFTKSDIVESRPTEDVYKFYKTGRTVKDLFTYAAYVEKVIDGDTLKVRLDLGFNVWNRQVLRLRDIDCPEVGTSEGDEARNFVRSHIKEAQMIIVRSSRSDKYDRYLADVFIPQSGVVSRDTDIYLNNLLLETGRAKRVG
ncbi:MAG: hypothetical protein A3D10_07640 [Omnitrophica WOR_2 bacterium RIFCSPHIGHO2_02_FULL_48_11]|nr:MAG: hypothetical protein A3D10_07640 [Omnitrophica WOR_2 bacterium RIFCSPHIGHO2_02_FULL_48_11]